MALYMLMFVIGTGVGILSFKFKSIFWDALVLFIALALGAAGNFTQHVYTAGLTWIKYFDAMTAWWPTDRALTVLVLTVGFFMGRIGAWLLRSSDEPAFEPREYRKAIIRADMNYEEDF